MSNKEIRFCNVKPGDIIDIEGDLGNPKELKGLTIRENIIRSDCRIIIFTNGLRIRSDEWFINKVY